MPRAMKLAARATTLGAGLAMALTCIAAWPTRADSGPPVRVALGELEGAAAGDAAFSDALRGALRGTPDVRITDRGHAQLVLRGSVVALERREVEGSLEIRCEVSVIVADARGGSIRAMLRGRAGARGADEDTLSRDALRAAARSALRPLASSGRALARRH